MKVFGLNFKRGGEGPSCIKNANLRLQVGIYAFLLSPKIIRQSLRLLELLLGSCP